MLYKEIYEYLFHREEADLVKNEEKDETRYGSNLWRVLSRGEGNTRLAVNLNKITHTTRN